MSTAASAIDLTGEEKKEDDDQLREIRRLRAEMYAKSLSPVVAKALKVVSYNVWFGEPQTYGVRMPQIFELCRGAQIVGLQEVTDDMHFPFAHIAKQRSSASYYCALASNELELRNCRTVDFPNSIMGRGLLTAHVDWPGIGDVVVGVVHLESWIGKDHDVRDARRGQVRLAQELMEREAQASKCAILMGDTNWDDETPFELRPNWKDTWIETGCSPLAKHTYDGSKNPMLRGHLKKRFDRILTTWPNISSFELLGTKALPGGHRSKKWNTPLAPSDHFGICATLSPTPQEKKKINPFFSPSAAKQRPATATYRGAGIPAPFSLAKDSLLVASFGENRQAGVEKSKPLAAFDFDDTLAILDYSRRSYWRHVYPHSPSVLKDLAETHCIAVLSNESLDNLKNLKPIEDKIKYKCQRLREWAKDVDVPVLVCVALSKKNDYHKSKGDGMFRFACERLNVTNLEESFFVGDSDHDKHMASVAQVTYHHVDSFFSAIHPNKKARVT